MPRPEYNIIKARRVLRDWIAIRIPLDPADAPITIATALEHLAACKVPAHRATFYKHKLHLLVGEGNAKQHQEGGGRQANAERRAYEEQLAVLRKTNEALEARNRVLLGQIAVMVWNAKRYSITHDELMAPMPKPDRSASHAGRRRRL